MTAPTPTTACGSPVADHQNPIGAAAPGPVPLPDVHPIEKPQRFDRACPAHAAGVSAAIAARTRRII